MARVCASCHSRPATYTQARQARKAMTRGTLPAEAAAAEEEEELPPNLPPGGPRHLPLPGGRIEEDRFRFGG